MCQIFFSEAIDKTLHQPLWHLLLIQAELTQKNPANSCSLLTDFFRMISKAIDHNSLCFIFQACYFACFAGISMMKIQMAIKFGKMYDYKCSS